MDFKKDYYKILEVNDNASEPTIKVAYRRLAKLYHPDRNPGDLAFEEKTKEINEAKEILLDAHKRFIYDEYRKSIFEQDAKAKTEPGPKRRHQRTKDTEEPESEGKPKKKKFYTRRRQVETVRRYYFKGTIFIKYYAPFDTEKADLNLRELFYEIHFTDVHIEIAGSDILMTEGPPAEYKNVFTDHLKTDIPVLQPVKVLITEKDETRGYLFNIHEFRITDPQITLVTKHESTSFGTIVSPVYGYVNKVTHHEITEEVEECSGPTGKQETKVENNVQYKREEFYKYNCETYWGEWQKLTTDYQQSGFTDDRPDWNNIRSERKKFNGYTSSAGCSSSTLGTIVSIIYIFFLLIAIPGIWPALAFFLIIYLLGSLINLITGRNIRASAWLVTLFVIVFFAILINRYASVSRPRPVASTVVESAREKTKPVLEPVHSYDPLKADTLITRFRSWADYDNQIYSGSYTVRASEVAEAALFKANLAYPVNTNNSYDHMVYDLKNHDSGSLTNLYFLFDTTRTNRGLRPDKFAEMIVSFVQDIPYSLVLDKACDPLQYNISSVREYLSKPGAICEPYQRFGINSPVEFLAGLKGDCDTRALLLYLLLSHYHYDVVMLTSDIYNHSLIGINLPYAGANYVYAGKSYTLWETTSPGFRPGLIPSEISDLNYWRISLKSQ